MRQVNKSVKNPLLDFFLILFSVLIILLVIFYSRNYYSREIKDRVSISSTPTVLLLEKAKVINVLDGDTIVLENNQKVRLIGIDAPEKYYDGKKDDCFAKEAKEMLKQLIEKQNVDLEIDISQTDKYDRLLRYVYLDEVLINEFLVRQGFAKASSIPPDTKYRGGFEKAQGLAENQRLGLWSRCQ